MDKVDNGVNYYIDKITKENKLAMLVNDYNTTDNEIFKQECYAKIKTILIEIYGIVGLSNV